METSEILVDLELIASTHVSPSVAYAILAAAGRIRELRDQLASLTVDYDNATRERAA